MLPGVALCEAIRDRSLLAFEYRGLPRIVAPYCHGFTEAGREVLRAIQVGGSSHSGGLGFGKLWTVSQIARVRRLDKTFVPDDPDYNPADRAMGRIHCRV
jgi:hypothetical protein